jgi:hypothetical protein
MDLYRVHVSLREIEPAIWRRIELSSQTTLRQFHRILQIAMGWENYHLHEYIVDGRRYGTPECFRSPSWVHPVLLMQRTTHTSYGNPADSRQIDVRYALHQRLDAQESKITWD